MISSPPPGAGHGVVLVTSRSFGSGSVDPAQALRDRGLTVERGPAHHGLDELADSLRRAVAWIAGTGPVTAAHLELAEHLRVVSRYGVGCDAVDVAAATRRGILVSNTPGANTDAVADHALALMLDALRHVSAGDRAVRTGDWRALPGRELGALTVGIVGFGRIGRSVAARLTGGFGCRVLVHDPFVEPSDIEAAGCQPIEIDALFATADVVTLHVPGGTEPLISEPVLATMRAGAIIVNTARGDLLDETAVSRALSQGRLGAVAVDVLSSEHGVESPLLNAPNVVVTPHVAAQTTEAIDRMGRMAVEAVLDVLDGQTPRHLVPQPPEPANP